MKITVSISLAPELGEAARQAAAEAGLSLSEWLAQAAQAKLGLDADAAIPAETANTRRSQALGEYLDEWEAEHGAFTAEELASAAHRLGLPCPPVGDSE